MITSIYLSLPASDTYGAGGPLNRTIRGDPMSRADLDRVEREQPLQRLRDVVISFCTCLVAILHVNEPPKEIVKRLIHRTRNFQQALEGVLIEHETRNQAGRAS